LNLSSDEKLVSKFAFITNPTCAATTRQPPPTTPRWRKRRLLKCVPPSVSVSGGDSINGGGGGGGGGGGRGGGGDDATIAAVRDTIAVIKQLPDFGVELAPAQLRWGLYTFANSVDP
jgi:hypothetical protein